MLALPEVLALDFGIPIQVFGRITSDFYEVSTCSDGGGAVLGAGGFAVVPQRGLELLSEADIVVVPGYTGFREPLPDSVRDALRAAHARGARMVSICTGAFALARAGILDGLPATTHWAHAQALAEQFPTVTVDPNVLFVDAGSVLTSAGVAAGIDLCLHIVHQDCGAAQGQRTARSTVAAPRREGGQAQFIEHRAPSSGSGRPDGLAAAMDWAVANLAEQITLAGLASAASMSQRTLCRRFETHIGLTPMKWLAARRIDRAKELLETTNAPIDRIAAAVGLGSGATFRQLFKSHTSLSPGRFRTAFSLAQPGATGLGRLGAEWTQRQMPPTLEGMP